MMLFEPVWKTVDMHMDFAAAHFSMRVPICFCLQPGAPGADWLAVAEDSCGTGTFTQLSDMGFIPYFWCSHNSNPMIRSSANRVPRTSANSWACWTILGGLNIDMLQHGGDVVEW